LIEQPRRITAGDDVSAFDSGVAALGEWLRRRALDNEASGASRTYVACEGNRVAGFYSLAMGAIAHLNAPGRIKRKMTDPVPLMLLGQLAVDRNFQGQGLGNWLLRDAILRTVQAAEIAGIRAILVHAISETAASFYQRRGFIPSPLDPIILMITVADARKNLGR